MSHRPEMKVSLKLVGENMDNFLIVKKHLEIKSNDAVVLHLINKAAKEAEGLYVPLEPGPEPVPTPEPTPEPVPEPPTPEPEPEPTPEPVSEPKTEEIPELTTEELAEMVKKKESEGSQPKVTRIPPDPETGSEG